MRGQRRRRDGADIGDGGRDLDPGALLLLRGKGGLEALRRGGPLGRRGRRRGKGNGGSGGNGGGSGGGGGRGSSSCSRSSSRSNSSSSRSGGRSRSGALGRGEQRLEAGSRRRPARRGGRRSSSSGGTLSPPDRRRRRRRSLLLRSRLKAPPFRSTSSDASRDRMRARGQTPTSPGPPTPCRRLSKGTFSRLRLCLLPPLSCEEERGS